MPGTIAYHVPSGLGLVLKPEKTEAAQSRAEGLGGGPRPGGSWPLRLAPVLTRT